MGTCHLSSIHADKGRGSRSDVVLPDASETENCERTSRALGPQSGWPAAYPVKVLLAAPLKVLLHLSGCCCEASVPVSDAMEGSHGWVRM